MKIIVTGGSGFIGTNLIEDLIEKDYIVKNYDINSPKLEARKDIWEKVDIRDIDVLQEKVSEFEPDYIVHLAARTDLDGKSIEDYDSNTLGTTNIVKVAEKCKSIKKVIFTSSMLVCQVGYHPKSQQDYSPSTLYGESKMLGEKYIWENAPACDWAIIRPTSIWGPWFGVPYRNFFDMVVGRRYFHIGHKSCTKTYGYVGNAVYEIEAIMLADTSDNSNKVFYIGDYEPTNIEKWANEIADELGYKIVRVPYWMIKCAAFCGDILKKMGIHFPMTSFRLKNMTTNYVVDMSNTEQIVGKLPLNRVDGVRNTLCWLKDKG